MGSRRHLRPSRARRCPQRRRRAHRLDSLVRLVSRRRHRRRSVWRLLGHSWHISIGRDTFWTPAHMMIYLAGVLAGVASGYAILSTTFGESDEAKDAGISVWGFR